MPETAAKNVNDFLREGWIRLVPTGKVQNQKEFSDFLEDFNRLADDCHFKESDIDFAYLMEMAPPAWFKAFRDYRDGMASEQKRCLREEADVAIKASYWDQFIDRCITRTLIDFSCQPADTILRGLTSRIDIPCSDFTDNKVCEFPLDPPPDFCCVREDDDERAKFYGLGDQRCWKLPKPCFISFAFALHRNLVCVDPNGEVRRMIEDRIKWFDIIDERAAARLFWGVTDKDCTFGYNYDGTAYASGYLCAGTPPWTNVLEDEDLFITGCTEAPLCAIEGHFEDMRDPYNCFPLACPGDLQMMVVKDCHKYPVLDLLLSKQIEYFSSGAVCNTEFTQNRGPRQGWSQEILMSRWVYDELYRFYASGNYVDCNGDTQDYSSELPAAAYAANHTYLVSKSWSQTFGFAVDYDVSTRELSGTDNWQYFDRGVTWMRRYDRKATFVWLRPWLTLLVRAFNPTNPGGLIV